MRTGFSGFRLTTRGPPRLRGDRGPEAIRQFYAGLIQQLPRFGHQFEPEAITVAQSGDLAVVRGSYRFTADTLKPEQVQVGKCVGVWSRRGGDWRLVLNISNSDRPRP